MRRTRFDDWDCSIARAVDIVGDWWTPMILRSAFRGVRRFEGFTDELGIPRNVLTERLNRLCDEGIFEKVEYQDRPLRHEYRLTDKGVGFYPVMVTLLQWGNDWLDWGEDGPPVHVADRASGARIEPRLVDARTGEELDPRRTTAVYERDASGGRPKSS